MAGNLAGTDLLRCDNQGCVHHRPYKTVQGCALEGAQKLYEDATRPTEEATD